MVRQLPAVSKLIVKHLHRLRSPTKATGPNHFRISQIGCCENQQTLSYLYPSSGKSTPAQSIRPGFGTYWHKVGALWMKRIGLPLSNIEREVSFKTGVLTFWGHIDGTFLHPVTGEPILVDFKTQGDFAFDSNSKKLDRMYLDQVIGYLFALRQTKEYRKIKWALVLLIALTGDLFDVYIRYDKARVVQIIKRCATVARNRRNNEQGKREYYKNKFPCTYCAHRGACWSLPANDLFPDTLTLSDLRSTTTQIRGLVRYIHKMQKNITEGDDTTTSCRLRAHEAARQLLRLTKRRKVIVPGILTVQLWGQSIRIGDAK